jgi:hypothetical protein
MDGRMLGRKEVKNNLCALHNKILEGEKKNI